MLGKGWEQHLCVKKNTFVRERKKDVVEFDIAWGVSNTNDDKVVASGKKSYTAPSIVYGCLGPIYYGEKLIFNVAEFDIPWDIHTFLSDYFLSELN
ncbi:predicted protein [Chaetoceros tenuissimus]|uniref:Uncharacterized protein n=1 Tax=Chaetoceros tenuissimus TaxID=426638 RepID=A0AAD3D0M1_9STRA|nr:predicted protein [Chaetoceros tenuissimus]